MRFLLCLFLLLVYPVQATKIYKIVHADGTVTYTDSPQPGAQPVDMSKVKQNIIQPIAKVPQNRAQTRTETTQQVSYQLSIRQPAPEATIRNNQGNVTISGEISPQASGQYRLLLNGEMTEQNGAGVFQLSGLDRGAYQYQLQFVSNSGKILASSNTQTFYLHKASALINPN